MNVFSAMYRRWCHRRAQKRAATEIYRMVDLISRMPETRNERVSWVETRLQGVDNDSLYHMEVWFGLMNLNGQIESGTPASVVAVAVYGEARRRELDYDA